MTPRFADHGRHARAIVEAVLEAADPAAALDRAWPGDLDDSRPVKLIAIGKASIEMARAAARRLGPSLKEGVVIAVPERMAGAGDLGPLRLMPGDHPLPTARNVEAAKAVAELAARAGPGDVVLLLISGGGSAHLCWPAECVGLEELTAITKALQRAGARIEELNCVRKHLERLKGGRLGVLLARAEVRALVLSDVMGDRLEAIASGPAVGDPTTFAEALSIVEQYRAGEAAPGVRAHLQRGARGEIDETPKPGDARLARIAHTIIAGNSAAMEAAARAVEAMGFDVVERWPGVEGEAASAGRRLAERLRELSRGATRPVAVVMGGETTVDVQGAAGAGGPSQEVALAAVVELEGADRIAVVAFSTDGVDGPTDAAGAVVTGASAAAMRGCGVEPASALREHDSHAALGRVGALVKTGPTGTNVNHIAVGLVYAAV